jgi:putative acetyltransferase
MILNEDPFRNLARELVRELGVVEETCQPSDISLSQCHILVELEKNGTLTANEISSLLVVDKSSVSRSIARLIEYGFITVIDGHSDRRRKPLKLTKAGLKKVSEIHKVSNLRVQDALKTLDAQELESAYNGLSLYVKALRRSRLNKSCLIRRLTKADHPHVIKIIRSTLSEFGADCSLASKDEHDELADICAAYSHPKSKFYVLERDGVLVGCGGLRKVTCHDKLNTCEMRRMYLKPEARGNGLGQLLLRQLLKDALELGYDRCFLETKSSMLQAQRLYEWNGFKRIRESLKETKKGCDLFYSKTLSREADHDAH